MALEADLNNEDIDICIVSETHLKPDIITGYSIFRQHRNWSVLDNRGEGGVAMFARSLLDVIDVYGSN